MNIEPHTCITGWWYAYPLKNISSSVGVMTFLTEWKNPLKSIKNHKNILNHYNPLIPTEWKVIQNSMVPVTESSHHQPDQPLFISYIPISMAKAYTCCHENNLSKLPSGKLTVCY
jgi:hypothetical protein